tara:strand:+ start:207 stop:563 length:357 start_codon:yes stop_codon:yes gene_type:complete
MNNSCIIAWLDDLQMSAHLAKISTTHSYTLQFCDTISEISDFTSPTAMIIDLNSISEDDLRKIVVSKQNHNVTLMGYCQDLNGPLFNYFKEMGCEMVFKRYELMKNLGSILNKIFNAS